MWNAFWVVRWSQFVEWMRFKFSRTPIPVSHVAWQLTGLQQFVALLRWGGHGTTHRPSQHHRRAAWPKVEMTLQPKRFHVVVGASFRGSWWCLHSFLGFGVLAAVVAGTIAVAAAAAAALFLLFFLCKVFRYTVWKWKVQVLFGSPSATNIPISEVQRWWPHDAYGTARDGCPAACTCQSNFYGQWVNGFSHFYCHWSL